MKNENPLGLFVCLFILGKTSFKEPHSPVFLCQEVFQVLKNHFLTVDLVPRA